MREKLWSEKKTLVQPELRYPNHVRLYLRFGRISELSSDMNELAIILDETT